MAFRQEQDSMGKVHVPKDAYYGAQTQRAADNFQISGLHFSASFIRAIGLIKKHAATTNKILGLLDKKLAKAIFTAANEVVTGQHNDQFVVDIFQTGSGTSTNMNANEVIAGRANEILTGKRGGKTPVHPNDHVNNGQSSNDVIPSTIHIAALVEITYVLLPALLALQKSLRSKSTQFKNIVKIGRTHLQDAVPMTLGQEFNGYANQVKTARQGLSETAKTLQLLALGGTALGTGLNTHPDFAKLTIAGISEETNCSFRETDSHFSAQSSQDPIVAVSGSLKVLAVSLMKIANDIRWLASGPRCGIGEIHIPSLQPGSSIMPGKVNPVIPEVVLQVAAQVIGNDTAITVCGQSGVFELNVMLPVMARNLLESIQLLSAAAAAFDHKCVQGITPNKERCTANLEQSLALATGLIPAIGYDKAAALSKKAYESGETIRHVALKEKILPADDIHRLLDDMLRSS